MTKLNKFAFCSVVALVMACLTMTGCSRSDKQAAPKEDKKVSSLEDLAGVEIVACDKTVTPYLIMRALQKHTKLGVKDIKIVNTSDEEIATTFLSNKKFKVVGTWNPMVLQILDKDKGARKLFDSSEIPGEIQDLCVVNTKALAENPDFARALAGAWYETLAVMQKGDQSSKQALSQMAALSGPSCTLDNYRAQLSTTAMFWNAKDAVAFTNSKDLQAKQDLVRKFCFDYGLLGEKATSADVVGIQYPDGTVQGDRNNVRMRYVSKYMQEYADGKVSLGSTDLSGAGRKKFKLAISVYAGWMPWYYAQESGILKKWADRYGLEIEVMRASYGGTIDAFVANQVDACLLTNMDTFFTPAAVGIDCTAVIMGDFSNGNDAIIVR